jgi:16S rRNA G1207 methylase RsmC
VEYSRQNAALNQLEGMEIYGSLGYDDVRQAGFDLVVANIPGKAGEAVIAYLLRDARYYLAPGGLVAVVAVAPLEATVSKILEDTPGIEITLKRNRAGHAVFHYRFSDESSSPEPAISSIERGVYHRGDIQMRFKDMDYKLQTAWGLPEFDSLGYGTEMLLKALNGLRKPDIHHAVVFNPGPGHIAVALWKYLKPENIVLVDRDLLALRYSRLNLSLNGCPPERVGILHQVGMAMEDKRDIDLFIGVLREAEGREAVLLTVRRAVDRLSSGGVIIVSAGSTAITRLLADVETEGCLRVKTRERWRGHSLLMLER